MNINTLPSNWSSLTDEQKMVLTIETRISRYMEIQLKRSLRGWEVKDLEKLQNQLKNF